MNELRDGDLMLVGFASGGTSDRYQEVRGALRDAINQHLTVDIDVLLIEGAPGLFEIVRRAVR